MKKTFFTIACLIVLYSVNLSAQDTVLINYIRTAINNSPEIAAKNSEYYSAMSDAETNSFLEDPEFSASVFPEPMMNVNGEQVASISVMQMFPWPGTLKNKKNEKMCMNSGIFNSRIKLTDELAYKVASAYYDMISLQEQIKIINEQLQLLESTEESLLYKYASQTPDSKQKPSLPELINLQLQREELSLQLSTAKENLETLKRQFNLLLHRSETTKIILPDSLAEENSNILQFTYSDVLKHSPEIGMLDAESKATQHSLLMQKKMSYPMFGVGAEYMINKQTDMPKMEDMNGKNMFMLMFKVTLPLYRKKYDGRTEAINLKTKSIALNTQQQEDNLKSEWIGLKQDYTNEQNKLVIYKKQMVLLEENLKILNTAYTTNQSSLTDLLNIREKLLNYKLKLIDTTTKLNKIKVKLNIITGNDWNNKTMDK
ncbi:MAG: TolC family protein [Bacteroidales bacterium]|nr:TolC family protein [Bacteroidales bacterium]